MHSPHVKEFIREQSDLFWFIPDRDKGRVSEACLVETILNYGSMDAVIRLVKLLGINTVARIFADSISRSPRRKNNYHELTRHYFLQVFQRYAPQYFN